MPWVDYNLSFISSIEESEDMFLVDLRLINSSFFTKSVGKPFGFISVQGPGQGVDVCMIVRCHTPIDGDRVIQLLKLQKLFCIH